jgi:ADP-heptose:LPS heptosyltransferase
LLVLGDDVAFVRAVGAAVPGVEVRAGLGTAAWIACIAGARALVTPDSGAAHVAGMTGVPCVDCFAPSASVAYDAARWRPWAAPSRVHVLDPSRSAAETAGRLVAALDALDAVGEPAVRGRDGSEPGRESHGSASV